MDCSVLIPGWEDQGRTQKGGVYYDHQGWTHCRESRGGGGPQARKQCTHGEQQSTGPARRAGRREGWAAGWGHETSAAIAKSVLLWPGPEGRQQLVFGSFSRKVQIQGRLSLDVSDRKRRCWGLLNVDSELREFMGQITPPRRHHTVRVRHTDLWETATERGAVRKERSDHSFKSRAWASPTWWLEVATCHVASAKLLHLHGLVLPEGRGSTPRSRLQGRVQRVLCMCISDRDAKRGPQGTRPDGPTWVHAGLMAQDPRMKL